MAGLGDNLSYFFG